MGYRLTSRLLRTERDNIIETIAEHTNSMREKLREARNWNELHRYIGLIGIRGVVEAPSLEPHEVEHVRKMGAYEAVSVIERKRRPRRAAGFWEDIVEQFGNEMAVIRHSGVSGHIPKKYEWASSDLGQVHELLENPLIIALRKSVHEAQTNRQK